MTSYVFDIETNGLLPEMDRIHCIVLMSTDSIEKCVYRSDKGGLNEALRLLEDADRIIGHNIMDFDIRAIQKIYPAWSPKGQVIDTLVLSRLIWPEIKTQDFARVRSKGFPAYMAGRHGLEAWGHRLGFHKGDYAKEMKAQGLEPWAAVNDSMVDYCVNDVELNVRLWHLIESKKPNPHAVMLEHEVWRHCLEQMRFGCDFDEQSASLLYAQLSAERATLARELKAAFGVWAVSRGPRMVKRSMKKFVESDEALDLVNRGTKKAPDLKRGYIEERIQDSQFTEVEFTEFNPASRPQIADRLMSKYNWKPTAYTDAGAPIVDEETLKGLDYPETKLLARYLLLQKRIGQISEGDQAWLKLSKGGRIHGRIDTNGAVTGRATHNRPNLAQVPRCGSYLGKECRSLFRASPGWSLVGADASGLELRCLAHYLARWDGGAYGDIILNGDIHTANQQAAGLPTRNDAKTFIYALLYGAGDAKIGSIIGKGPKAGKALKVKFMEALPAYKNLVKGISQAVKLRGYLTGLDGRILPIRSDHAALNTLLQSAGAVIMKQAMVNFHIAMACAGYHHGNDYRQVLWVHDEFQVECKPELAEFAGKTMVEAIRNTTADFNFRCPLDGEFKVGKNWAETH